MRLPRFTKMPDNGFFMFGTSNPAAAGTNQATATVLTSQINIVTAADGTKGVALPDTLKAKAVFIVNTVAGSSLKVYPANSSGHTINGGGANASVNVAGGQSAWFIPVSSTAWFVDLNSAAAASGEIAVLAGVTPGVIAASKAVVVDANKDAASFRVARAARVITAEGVPSSSNNAGANTITAAILLSGIYVRDCNGAGRTDTFDTAANIVAALPGAAVGDIIRLLIVNGTNGAFAITLAVPASGAFDGNQAAATRIIGQNTSKTISLRLTNVTGGAEAYVVYA